MQPTSYKQDGRFDLEHRTLIFSKELLSLTKQMAYSIQNEVIVRQLIRSGTSIGANYREANDALGKKDFLFRLRIARKEAKETTYWLQLLEVPQTFFLLQERSRLLQESVELTKILSSIINKSL